MRMDQYIGLNERGQKLVEMPNVSYTDYIIRVRGDGSVVEFNTSGQDIPDGYSVELVGEIEGAFGPAGYLRRYVFPNKVLTEKVQAEPWSSGPCYFVALVDENDQWVEESLWTDKEMDESL